MKLRSVGSRLRQVSQFGRSAMSIRDLPAACLLGIARGSPFNNSNRVTAFGSRYFPRVNVRPRALMGGTVSIDTSDLGQLVSYEEIMVEGCYNLQVVPFIPSLILDCGAHVGFFTLLASAQFPEAKIHAFEPNPQNFPILEQHCRPLAGRVRLFQVAVSVEEKECWFQADDSNTGQLLSDGRAGVKVKTVDARKIVATADGESLLIKIDVEGEERRIIPAVASRLPSRCAIFFETHHGLAAWQAVTEALTCQGFNVQVLRERGYFRDGFACRMS